MSSSRRQQHAILIVDDEADVAESLRDVLLGGLGEVTIDVAHSGPEAMAFLENRRVDLLISDFRMPGMTGLELLEVAAEKDPGMARILVTAFAEPRLALSALQDVGAMHFFRKPYDPSEVVNVAGAVLTGDMTPERRAEAFRRSMELAQPQRRPT
jgi:DNA-binding NtrC family response regulator